jgi:hypothetical protein
MKGHIVRIGCKRQGNNKLGLKQIWCENMHRVHLTEDANQ